MSWGLFGQIVLLILVTAIFAIATYNSTIGKK